MKLLFLCGSLEPGRDGVGDYTRRLAGACAARGHACTLVALHDRHATHAVEQAMDGLDCIRLPATDPWPGRIACAAGHVRRLAPDWVSWQFVAYGLQRQGCLPGALLRGAPDLRGPRCHVMLHELWLGLETGSGWRDDAVGWWQRRRILDLLNRLNPDCLQTTQTAYQRALLREGFNVSVLGLFGNIPITNGQLPGAPPLARWLPPAVARGGAAAPLVAVSFGTLHPQWQPAATVRWLCATARRHGRQPAFIAIGRTGAHAAAVLDAFHQQGVPAGLTGELDAATVSHLLVAADFGIAPHPWELIGKSGVAAAMLEHGLPVLVPRDDWRLHGALALPALACDPLLARLKDLDAARTDRWLATRRKPESALPRTADALLYALGHHLHLTTNPRP